MKKINTLSIALKQSMDVLTVSQMSLIRGGTGTPLGLTAVDPVVAGPVSATDDDKRRDRPGGGISTH